MHDIIHLSGFGCVYLPPAFRACGSCSFHFSVTATKFLAARAAKWRTYRASRTCAERRTTFPFSSDRAGIGVICLTAGAVMWHLSPSKLADTAAGLAGLTRYSMLGRGHSSDHSVNQLKLNSCSRWRCTAGSSADSAWMLQRSMGMTLRERRCEPP